MAPFSRRAVPRMRASDFFTTKEEEESTARSSSDSEDDKSSGKTSTAKFDPLSRVQNSDDEEEDEDSNAESEDEDESKDKAPAKFEEEDSDDEDDEEEDLSKGTQKSTAKVDVFSKEETGEDGESDFDYDEEDDGNSAFPDSTDDKGGEDDEEAQNRREKNRRKQLKAAEAAVKRSKKSGLVYISKVPEFMTPGGMRHILSKYGELDRIYLVPEPAAAREQRAKNGGSKQRMYTEGWAEFVRKKDAKLCASVLNGRGSTIGGKNRRSRYYDVVMAVRYLKKFKWNDLAEQMVVEKEARVEKLRKEIGMANEENRMYAQGVAMAKAIKKHGNRNEDGTKRDDVLRTFDQRSTKTKRAAPSEGEPSAKKPKTEMSSILSKIF